MIQSICCNDNLVIIKSLQYVTNFTHVIICSALWLAQEPGNSLSVIDVTSKTNTKTIDLHDYKRPHGLEFINDNEVLVTSEATQTLIKIDITSGKVSEVAKTGQAVSHMIAYSKNDHKVIRG